jgi:hypothetical protein
VYTFGCQIPSCRRVLGRGSGDGAEEEAAGACGTPDPACDTPDPGAGSTDGEVDPPRAQEAE